MLYEI